MTCRCERRWLLCAESGTENSEGAERGPRCGCCRSDSLCVYYALYILHLLHSAHGGSCPARPVRFIGLDQHSSTHQSPNWSTTIQHIVPCASVGGQIRCLGGKCRLRSMCLVVRSTSTGLKLNFVGNSPQGPFYALIHIDFQPRLSGDPSRRNITPLQRLSLSPIISSDLSFLHIEYFRATSVSRNAVPYVEAGLKMSISSAPCHSLAQICPRNRQLGLSVAGFSVVPGTGYPGSRVPPP
jgi:hypothetical protein